MYSLAQEHSCHVASCFSHVSKNLKLTHWYVVKEDVSDVVVGAALPRVVQPEAKGAGVATFQRCVFPKCTVLHVDGPIVDLHAPDREITAGTHTHQKVHYMLM